MKEEHNIVGRVDEDSQASDRRSSLNGDERMNPQHATQMPCTSESEVLREGVDCRDSGVQARGMADTVARRSYGKLVAYLAARTRDVAAAEDALSEAFATALLDWPRNGCPSKPEAWLLTVARRNLIDIARARRRDEIAAEQLQVMAEGLHAAATDMEIPDKRLALMFACAHPAIETGIRAPLMLQVVLGLDARVIASAFLVSPVAMGKRLVRAKNKIRHAGIPFSIPQREELAARLDAVLDAIYAAFAEGWTDAGGTDVARRDLGREAVFLGELLTKLLPQEPEALGLLALMLHAEARRGARRNVHGEYVPFAAQDTSLWDSQMIDAAESLLLRASAGAIGRYQLEALFSRPTCIAAARVTTTGRRSCNYTTHC